MPLIQVIYKGLAQPFLFSLSPETAHNIAVGGLRFVSHVPGISGLIKSQMTVSHSSLEVKIGSLTCSNPLGLAAGFDKSATLLKGLSLMGFGLVEVGTLTPLPQPGQQKPRLFRFKDERSLVNRMGFNNTGVKKAVARIATVRETYKGPPIGINIGKGKETPLENAIDDYLNAFEVAFPEADYIALNLSSPNTPGLRELQGKEYFERILKDLTDKNEVMAAERGGGKKLIFVKISPDNSDGVLSDIVDLALQYNVGIIATNTTVQHSHPETGGLSGQPLRDRANNVLRDIGRKVKKKIPIIGVGGVFTAEDAYQKIKLGASLVQIYTGWIYRGPGMVPRINRELISLMRGDGFAQIQDAVGVSVN